MLLIRICACFLFLLVAMSTLHAVLIQRDGEFDESDTSVSDLVATLKVLLVHPTIDLSLLVDPVCLLLTYLSSVVLFYVMLHRWA